MIVYPYLGQSLCHQKIIPGDTSTGISAYCYTYSEFFLNVSGVDAGSTEPTAGQWIVGNGLGKACIISYVLNTGAWGANTARVTLRLKSWNSTVFVAAENIAIAGNADHFTADNPLAFWPCPRGYLWDGSQAQAMLVSVYANTALTTLDKSIPDATSLIGQPMVAGSSIIVCDANIIRNFKCINYTAATACIVQVTLYF